MDPFGCDVRLSLARSSGRRRALIMLCSLGQAYPRQLARFAHVPSERIRGILEGAPPKYSGTLSLVRLGLAAVIDDRRGHYYVITNRGRRYARRLTARGRGRRGKRRALDE